MEDLNLIFSQLKKLIAKYEPPFLPKTNTARYYDLWSFKDLEIAGRKRKEVFFAGIIIQKSYVGFYFMPVYTQPEIKSLFQPELLKTLKGKSCFHIKKLDSVLLKQIEDALKNGFDLYQTKGWI